MIKSNLKSKQSNISLKRSFTSQISSLQNNILVQKQLSSQSQQRLNDKLLNIEVSLNDKLNFLRKTKIFYLQKLNELQDNLTVLYPSQQKTQNQKYNSNETAVNQNKKQNQNYLKSLLNQTYILSQQLNCFTQKPMRNINVNQFQPNAQNIVQQIIFLKHANQNLQKNIQQKINQQSLRSLDFQGNFSYLEKKISHLQNQIILQQQNLKLSKSRSKNSNLIDKYTSLKVAQVGLQHDVKLKEYKETVQSQAKIKQIQKIVDDYQIFLREEQQNKQKLFQQIYQKKLQFQATKKQNIVIKAIIDRILNNPPNF